MPPTQSTHLAAPTGVTPTKLPAHQVSIPAMVVLVLFLSMMTALVIGVVLRQRRAMATLKHKEGIPQEKQRSAHTSWRWFSRFKSAPTAANDTPDSPTAVGALHATSVLLAAAPCQAFSSPMTMQFKLPLEGKTVLILGVPWFPVQCGARYCGTSAGDCPETRQ